MSTQTENKTLSKASSKKALMDELGGEETRRKLVAVLPRTISPERFLRITFQALHNNPELTKCTQESFLNCLLKLGAMGLEPDGRRAHLIPFGSECTLVVDYKGIKELVRRNRDVSVMHGDVVGENDQFEVRYGTRGILDHVPNLQNRGRIYCAYSWVKLPDGNEEYDVMSTEEIESVRNRSRSAKKGPWVTDWNEMAKKTVFRRHAKGLPLSPDTRDALERENDADALTEVQRFNAAAPARATVLGGNRMPRPTRIDTGEAADGSLATEGNQEQDPQGVRFGQQTYSTISHTGAPQVESPKEPVGDEEPAGSMAAPAQSLAAQVATRLGEAGYTQAELLGLMKPLKLAPRDAQGLEDVSDHHLSMVVDQWDNVITRLGQEREVAREKGL